MTVYFELSARTSESRNLLRLLSCIWSVALAVITAAYRKFMVWKYEIGLLCRLSWSVRSIIIIGGSHEILSHPMWWWFPLNFNVRRGHWHESINVMTPVNFKLTTSLHSLMHLVYNSKFLFHYAYNCLPCIHHRFNWQNESVARINKLSSKWWWRMAAQSILIW